MEGEYYHRQDGDRGHRARRWPGLMDSSIAGWLAQEPQMALLPQQAPFPTITKTRR